MPKPTSLSGKKNLISKKLIQLRKQKKMSQRDLAGKLQLAGYDMDKNVITRIETDQRYVTDIELCALSKILNVRIEDLIEEDIET
jgi:transcriptional regulator with XRE-family HTH domain